MGYPWYDYPLDSPGGGYGEGIDPVCNGGLNCTYLKPDTNIAVPPNVPITSIANGIVTDVSNRGSGDGGLSVTVKLDRPINNKARYVSYNFLGSTSVGQGQRVSTGQKLGMSGSPTGINFALALGDTPSWGTGTFPQGHGDPLFNPHIVLDALRQGQVLPTSSDTGGDSGNSTSDIGTSIMTTVTSLLKDAAVFILALLFIVVGVVILKDSTVQHSKGSVPV